MESTLNKKLMAKPPVVTVMGHVNHGKTTLLDYIRKTKVAEKEAGGITQKIGAYQVEIENKKITFIDTPGHAAFAKMRAMGGNVADIVIIVIAADDGVMPQTLESINLARQTKIPIVIAINKVDIASSDPNKIKKQLADENVLVEGWGGTVVCVEISAKSGKGVDELLEVMLLMAEMLELRANPKGDLLATVIESKMDQKRGAVSAIVVQSGTLEVGDTIYSQDGQKCKVRALNDFRGTIKKAVPGDAVEILGFSKPVKLGSGIFDKKESVGQTEAVKNQIIQLKGTGGIKKKQLNLIIKADTRGSLDAIESSLKAVIKEDVEINVIVSVVGNVGEGDVLLANASRAIILAFNVQTPRSVSDMAERYKVIIRTYQIIYDLLQDVDGALQSIIELEEEKIKGIAQVIAKFKLPKSGDIIAGCKVLSGRLRVKDKLEIWETLEEMKKARESEDKEIEIKPLYIGVIKNLKIEKDEVNVAGKDNEVGVFLNPPFPEVKVGYIIAVL